MKNIKSWIFYSGIGLFIIGLVLSILFSDSRGTMRIIPFVIIGYSSGIIGVGIAGIIMRRKMQKKPELARQTEIKEKDERLIRIREKAGYIMWFITILTISAVIITFLIMNNLLAVFIMIGFLFVHVVIYFVVLYVIMNRM